MRAADTTMANRLDFERRDRHTYNRPRRSTAPKAARRQTTDDEHSGDRYVQPTLRQAWPRECPRPQFAFKISMFNVSCNSHYFTQLAALFIDTRAE